MTATGSGGTPSSASVPGHRDPAEGTESDLRVPPVAIIGIGCRVPGAHGAREFWKLLREGRDATAMSSRDRGGVRRGGYLDRLDEFDNEWFGISEREAAVMDPQQRLALQVAVEALDDAGVGYRVRGSQSAVLFGACGYDHGTAVLGRGGHDAPYAVTGSALSIIANRLSYALDLHGPSLVLDSACSSSLAAVDMAMRLLADHTVELAVVGGVNLALLQHTSDYLDQSGFLAPDGRCKPFDAAADGYTRSDGCTVLVLQRTADARREGNRIYAEILGTAVGSDGRSNGLYAPNGLAQQEVIRRAWARAGVAPTAAGYIECHGTGTPLGDAVEVGALAAVLSGGQPRARIWIGSVKSNLGHLEAAAGITGVAKAALSIAHATVVPNVHFRTENPLLGLAARGLAVPTEPIGWAGAAPSSRYAGVSSFGFGGTNAHLVLRGVDPVEPQPASDPPTLLTISGRDADDLRARVLHSADVLTRATCSLEEFASAAARSIPEALRAAVIAHDRTEAVARLLELAGLSDTGTTSEVRPAGTISPAASATISAGAGGTAETNSGTSANASATTRAANRETTFRAAPAVRPDVGETTHRAARTPYGPGTETNTARAGTSPDAGVTDESAESAMSAPATANDPAPTETASAAIPEARTPRGQSAAIETSTTPTADTEPATTATGPTAAAETEPATTTQTEPTTTSHPTRDKTELAMSAPASNDPALTETASAAIPEARPTVTATRGHSAAVETSTTPTADTEPATTATGPTAAAKSEASTTTQTEAATATTTSHRTRDKTEPATRTATGPKATETEPTKTGPTTTAETEAPTTTQTESATDTTTSHRTRDKTESATPTGTEPTTTETGPGTRDETGRARAGGTGVGGSAGPDGPRFRFARKGLVHNTIGDVGPDAPAGRGYGPSAQRRRGRVLLVFSGQGGQHVRMGRGLAARYPVFARAVAEAADAVVEAGGPRVWTPRHGFAHSIETTEVVQPALFVFQIAMTQLLGHWGIRPDAVIGHSLGEIAAAVAGGGITLRDGARIIVARSAILAALDGRGAMAVLEATAEEAWRLVEPVRAHVAVAAVNGPRSVVVSGTPRYVRTLIRRATRRGFYARPIAVDFAAHSPQVREPAAELLSRLDAITPNAPRIPLYSTTRRGAVITSAAMDAKYWAENAEHTVELADALETAAAGGCTTAIEISPHPVLAPAIREYPDFREATHPIADREDESAAFLGAMARLYLEGRPANWSALGTFTGQAHERHWRHRTFELLTDPLPGPVAEDLGDHIVRGVPIVPAMYWLRQFLRVTGATRLTEFTVGEPADLIPLGDIAFRTGPDLIEVSGPATPAAARPAADPTPAEIVGWMRTIDAHRINQAAMHPRDVREFYTMLAARGLDYGPNFRPLRAIVSESYSAIGLLGHIPMDTAALDGCLQLIAATLSRLPAGVLPLPARIDSAWLSPAPDILLAQAHAFLRETTPEGLRCDVLAVDQHGAPAAALLGVHIHYARLPESADLRRAGADRARLAEETRQNAATRSFTDSGQQEPVDHVTGNDVEAGSRRSVAGYVNTVPAQVDSVDHTPDIARTRGSADIAGDTFLPHGLGDVLRRETWVPVEEPDIERAMANSRARRVLVIGESRLAVGVARGMERWLPTERVARDPLEASPIAAATLAGRGEPTAVIAVWPAVTAAGPAVREIGRALELLQRILECDAMASLTVVLRDRENVPQQGIAGLVRSLQLESGRPVRLVWAGPERNEPGPIAGLALSQVGPDEVRTGPGGLQARQFEVVSRIDRAIEIRSEGAYVVTGGLGALGAAAARWLLDSGAGDVVLLTRHPRPLPPLLEGLEDRIVVLRCDITDAHDLTNALHDIRECGPPIRGLIHSAGILRDAEFGSVTTDMLTAIFEPKLAAAAKLLDLTANDPIDFTLLFSSATGALGAPGQSAYAAANAALDALAASRDDRRITSIGWGSWESGLAEAAGGAEHLRRAGITPFTIARGTAVLDAVRGFPGTHILAMDYTPAPEDSPISRRLRTLLPMPPRHRGAAFAQVHDGTDQQGAMSGRARHRNATAPVDDSHFRAETGLSTSIVADTHVHRDSIAERLPANSPHNITAQQARGSRPEPTVFDSDISPRPQYSRSEDTHLPNPGPPHDPAPDTRAATNLPIAHVIRGSMAAVLGVTSESIGADEDFTGLGLSSLLAIELRRTLEGRLGIRIATAELFEHPTVALLADALSALLPDSRGERR